MSLNLREYEIMTYLFSFTTTGKWTFWFFYFLSRDDVDLLIPNLICVLISCSPPSAKFAWDLKISFKSIFTAKQTNQENCLTSFQQGCRSTQSFFYEKMKFFSGNVFSKLQHCRLVICKSHVHVLAISVQVERMSWKLAIIHTQNNRGKLQNKILLANSLKETTRTPLHHMAEHHTAGSEIPQSHTAWSNGYGPEPVSVEDVVDVRRYAILSCMPETTTNGLYACTH